MPNDSPIAPSADLPVTVVVASRDRPHLLRESLAAVERTLRPIDSMVVVDSASRDADAIARITAETSGSLIRCNRPGTSRARNAGWRAASTQLIAFTDDDCLPCEGWIEAIVKAFDQSPPPDIVTGRVLPDAGSNGRVQIALSVITTDEAATFIDGDDVTMMGHGANMAWRRSALENIGGFDEALGPGAMFGAGSEDADAFLRALHAGGLGRFDPRAVVVHRQWRGRLDQLRSCFGYGVGLGALSVKTRRLQDPPEDENTDLAGRLAVGRLMIGLVWRHGVVEVGRNLAHGYQMGVLVEFAMLAGALRGVLKTHRLQLERGHFVIRE